MTQKVADPTGRPHWPSRIMQRLHPTQVHWYATSPIVPLFVVELRIGPCLVTPSGLAVRRNDAEFIKSLVAYCRVRHEAPIVAEARVVRDVLFLLESIENPPHRHPFVYLELDAFFTRSLGADKKRWMRCIKASVNVPEHRESERMLLKRSHRGTIGSFIALRLALVRMTTTQQQQQQPVQPATLRRARARGAGGLGDRVLPLKFCTYYVGNNHYIHLVKLKK
jgi:hypothetical protein